MSDHSDVNQGGDVPLNFFEIPDAQERPIQAANAIRDIADRVEQGNVAGCAFVVLYDDTELTTYVNFRSRLEFMGAATSIRDAVSFGRVQMGD